MGRVIWMEDVKETGHSTCDNISVYRNAIECEAVNWIYLTKDGGPLMGSFEHGNWRTDSLKFQKKKSWSPEWLLISHDGLCSMKLEIVIRAKVV
jgi:hypothetical protein